MSTFNVNTPKPGWEKRWPREAGELLMRSPGMVAALLAILVATGVAEEMVRFHVRNFWASSLFEIAKVSFIGAPAVAWFFFQLGRKEGYNHGRFRNYSEAVRATIYVLVIILPLALLFKLPPKTHPVSLWGVIDSADQTLFLAFIWTIPFTFKLLGIAMMGWMSEVERKIIVDKAAAVLMSTVGLFQMVGLTLFLVFLPDIIRLPLMVFIVFWLYVAGREIIGGITGNKQEEKIASLAPNAA